MRPAFWVVLLASAAPTFAMGQTLQGDLSRSATVDLFARDRNVGVRERPHPEYEAPGLPFGALTLFPKLQTDLEYIDNVFAVAQGQEADVVLRLRPDVSLESSWSRHSAQLYARGSVNRFAELTSENTADYELGGAGRLDLLRSTVVSGGAAYGKATEPRTSSNTPTGALEPIRFDYGQLNVAASHVFNRFRVSGRADLRSFDYQDAPAPNGRVLDQDDRDRRVTSLTGRGDYAISPDTAVFVQATGNKRQYDVTSTPLRAARDSSGYEVLAGADFQLSNLIRGELAAGYLSQKFDDPRFEDINGFGARGRLEYFVTELTTVTGTLSRSVEDAGIIGSAGFLSTQATVQVDHELLRNVILSASASHFRDEYETIDRNDTRWQFGANATYLLNRRVGVSLGYSRYDQNSEGRNGGLDFAVNRVIASLIVQL